MRVRSRAVSHEKRIYTDVFSIDNSRASFRKHALGRQHAFTSAHCAGPSFDLQNQRDEFALAMCVGLGKDRFQLIARRLP